MEKTTSRLTHFDLGTGSWVLFLCFYLGDSIGCEQLLILLMEREM